jgi:transglutaminase-like putative cysteine protease
VADGRVRIVHVTRYLLERQARRARLALRLTPRALAGLELEHHEMSVRPAPVALDNRTDRWGNAVSYIEIDRPFAALEVVSTMTCLPGARAATGIADAPWEAAVTADAAVDAGVLGGAAPELASFARPSFTPGRPLRAALGCLVKRVSRRVRYDERAASEMHAAVAVLRRGRGVCRDLAHVTAGCLRSIGLAARYVSGYLATPGRQQPHAWVSIQLADGRWLDADPTHAALAPQPTVTLAWGRDYDDVAPASGTVFSSGRCRLFSSVRVLDARSTSH